MDLHVIANHPLIRISNSRAVVTCGPSSQQKANRPNFSQNMHFGYQPSGNIHPVFSAYNARLLLLSASSRQRTFYRYEQPPLALCCSAVPTQSLPAPSPRASLETRNCLSLLVQTGPLHIAVEAVPSESSSAAGSNR